MAVYLSPRRYYRIAQTQEKATTLKWYSRSRMRMVKVSELAKTVCTRKIAEMMQTETTAHPTQGGTGSAKASSV